MPHRLRTIVGSAALLLLVGAGCAGSGTVDTNVDTSYTPPPSDTTVGTDIQAGTDSLIKADATTDVDAAVDAYLEGAAAEDAQLETEARDAASLETDVEINAYGQAYDKNEF